MYKHFIQQKILCPHMGIFYLILCMIYRWHFTSSRPLSGDFFYLMVVDGIEEHLSQFSSPLWGFFYLIDNCEKRK